MATDVAHSTLSVMPHKAALRSARRWAEDIYAGTCLPDHRLYRRLLRISETLAAAPTDPLTQACADRANVKGAYRFIENKRLMPEHLERPLSESTAKRCANLEVVLCVQDTTTLSFPAACHAEGLGRINSSPSRGVLLHTAMGVTLDGLPLGIMHMHSWCRKDDGKRARERANWPIEKKESVRWLNAMRASHQALEKNLSPEKRPRLYHVADRESDIHEFFALARELGDALVVRCARNRRVETENGTGKAHDSIEKSSCRGRLEIQVPRAPGRHARKTVAEVRFQSQTLSPSKTAPLQRSRGKVPLWLIEVRETQPPKGEKPLRWLLWTNEAIESLQDAVRIVEIYRKRWRIEDYHRILKEGCRLEKVRFHTADRIRLITALYAPVAMRILEMREAARLYPRTPCTVLLSDIEWRVLWTMRNKRPPSPRQTPPTLEEATRWIGGLGGHLGRKRDGMPGVKTLWRGFRDLQILTAYEKTREPIVLRNPP